MSNLTPVLEAQLIRHLKKMALDPRVRVELEGAEREEFLEAKASRNEREIRATADSFGLTLAVDMCKEIAPYLRSDIDRDDFSSLFVAAVGRFTLFDFDEEWAKRVAAIANTEGLFPASAQ